jgi:hypothetical protein
MYTLREATAPRSRGSRHEDDLRTAGTTPSPSAPNWAITYAAGSPAAGRTTRS